MDSMMSEGTGSMRRSVRMGRPPAVTSTSSRPVRPCSASSQVFDALLADHVGAAVVAQLAGALQILESPSAMRPM